MQYKILSHTADLRLEVYGKTPEELFMNAAEAIGHILLPQLDKRISTKLRERVEIESFNQNTLLVDFLNAILSKSQINKMIYFVESIKIKDNSLSAELSGTRVDKFEEDIKAVTYHETEIKKEGDTWKTKLVLDI